MVSKTPSNEECALKRVHDAARSFLPPSLALGARRISSFMPLKPENEGAGKEADKELFPQEEDTANRMVPARRAEFTAGRSAARLAMDQLGVIPCAIPQGPDRAPIWPKGVNGSITHTKDIALCVMGALSQWEGIGIDLEEDAPLKDDLIKTVLTPKEREFFKGAADQGLQARRIFCAKEALFKALYPRTKTFIGFEGAQILEPIHPPDPATITLLAPFGQDLCGRQLKVHTRTAKGYFITAVLISFSNRDF